MANDELTRSEYLNALLRQKNQLKETGMNVVNPSLVPLASIDTSFQTGVDKTNVPTEAEIKNVTKPQKNGWETAWDNVFGFVDEIAAKFGAGFVSGWEGILDLGATAIGALGDATGWYEGDIFTDWAKQDIGTALAEWTKTYANYTPWGIAENIMNGNYANREYWRSAGEGALDILDSGFFASNQIKDYRQDADKYYGMNDEALNEMGGFGQFLGGAAHSIGFMLPAIMTGGGGAVGKAATLGTMFLGSSGKGSEQALKEGASSDKALAYGLASGAVETATEVLVGKFLGKAAKALHLEDFAKGFGKINGVSIGKEMLGKVTAKQFAASMLEEGAEEVVATFFQPVIESIYKGNSAYYDENGNNVYTTPEFWSEVVTSFLSGAFVSGLTGGVENVRINRRYGKDGAVFIQNNQKYNELIDEYKQKQFKKEDTTEIEKQIKELAITLSNNLETIAKSKNKKYLENLMFDYAKSANSKLKAKEWNAEKTTEMTRAFRESFDTPVYKKLTNDINSVLEKKGSNIKIRWATEQELREGLETENNEPYYDNAGNIRGFYIPSEGTVVINEKYSNEVASIVKHELVSHAILDTNETAVRNIIEYIENDKELSKVFHKHDADIEKEYSKDEIESERLATFVEEYINDYDSFIDAIEGNKSLKSKMVSLLRNIKRAVKEKGGKLNNKLLKNIEKSLNALLNNETKNKLKEEPAIQFSKKLGKNVLSSPISHQGNKFKLIERLLPLFPEQSQVKRFIDVFGGSLTVSMNVNYETKVVNEIHPLLQRMYGFLIQPKSKKSVKEVVEFLKKRAETFKLDTKEGFDALKEAYNSKPKNEKPIWDLFLLNKYGTSGTLVNVDSKTYDYKGEWSERNSNPNWNLILSKMTNFRKTLKDAKYYQVDCVEMIDKAQEGDFLYCDPPYSNTNAVYNEGWTEEDDKRLMEALDRATDRGVRFALSNIFSYNGKENKQWIEWSKKYRTSHFEKKYHFGEADEVLICNYNETGKIINEEKEKREQYKRYFFSSSQVKEFVEPDLQVYFDKEWKGFYENISPAEKRFLEDVYGGKISIFSEKGKDNFKRFYDALLYYGKKTFDKNKYLKYRYWSPEMKMLAQELRKIGTRNVHYALDEDYSAAYDSEENEIIFNLFPLSYFKANILQKVVRHERYHFLGEKYPDIFQQFANDILSRIDRETYKELLDLDQHGTSYYDQALEMMDNPFLGEMYIREYVKEKISKLEGITNPIVEELVDEFENKPSSRYRNARILNNILLLEEVLADIYAQKPDRIKILKKVIPVNEINSIVNTADEQIEKRTKTKLKFSKAFGSEVSAPTVKGAAVETVITLGDTQDVVEEVFNRVKDLFPSTITLPNKLLTTRLIFNEYNLKSKKDKKLFLNKVIKTIFETEIEFAERDASGIATGNFFTGTLEDYLLMLGYKPNAVIDLIAEDFYTAMDLKSKTSEREKALINLKMTFNLLKNNVRRLKRKVALTFKAYRGVCKLKEEIKTLKGVEILNN
jgi:site-specific DNA-adenine methylase